MTRTKKYMLGLMGAGMLVLPMTMASTAQADDLRISLNLGGGAPVYYSQPRVQHVVYREAPVQRVVYRPAPQRVVYVDKHHRGRGHGHHYAYGHGNGHGRWDNRGDRVAWR